MLSDILFPTGIAFFCQSMRAVLIKNFKKDRNDFLMSLKNLPNSSVQKLVEPLSRLQINNAKNQKQK